MSPRNTFAATRRSHTILRWLKSGRAVRIEDVSEAFGIEYAQARADLKLLEDEYELQTGRDGRIKVWKWSEFDPDHMDVATAASLELGAIAIDLFKDTPYGESIDNLADYCRNRLPDEFRDDVDRLSRSLHLRRTWLPTNRSEVEYYLECALDSLDKHWLVGRYTAADGDRGDYVIFPRRLIWYQGRLWLLGHHEAELKLFDLAGFEALEVDFGETDTPREELTDFLRETGPLPELDRESDETSAEQTEGPAENSEEIDFSDDQQVERAVERRWTPSEPEVYPLEPESESSSEPEPNGENSELDADPAAYFENSFGIYAQSNPVKDVHLEVNGKWKAYFERYRMHPSQQNDPAQEGDSLHVRFHIEVCPEFKSFLLGMIPHVQIHEPEALRDELRGRVYDWIGEDETDQPGA